MRLQVMQVLVAFGAALALGACASTAPATHVSSVDLSGYVRVVSDGQELFCHKESQGRFLQDVCYTRSELKERLLTRQIAGVGPVGPAPVPVNQTSMYYFSPSGR
jgi:hypothetical protein